MHVVLSGASGLIGTALTQALRADGDRVTALVRRPASGPDERTWNPATGELDPGALAGADAVVCLSGAGVGDKRWTSSYKNVVVRSRVDSVATIARTMAALDDGPRVLLSGSAVGYYGDTGEREVDESAGPGAGFLSGLCVEWEAAAAPARDAGIRVANLRTGIVLDRRADLVKRLRPIFALGLGGRFGSGRQFMSFISLADEVSAIRFLLSAEVTGPVNLTSPQPVRNAEFAKTLGSLLHRPALLPVPGIALRIAVGDLGNDALTGQRALPAVLTSAGFRHRHADLKSALTWALRG
jgi:uncharacterized protein (TIGR01777 family)